MPERRIDKQGANESSRRRVLIIDDENGMRNMLRELLEDEGFDVVTASDGVAGMMLMEAQPADLVITDLIMPDMGGNEAIFTLKREFPGTLIIAMSGGGRKSDMSFLRIAGKQGADRMVEKPFDLDVVVGMVRELLSTGPKTGSPDEG